MGVSFDSQDENRSFAQKFDFNFPLLCDQDRQMGLAYGACTTEDAEYANRIGVIIDADGLIKEYEPAANAKTYAVEVLAQL